MLWFMGSQRVGHDWATEMNWTEWLVMVSIFLCNCWPFVYLLGEKSIQELFSFLGGGLFQWLSFLLYIFFGEMPVQALCPFWGEGELLWWLSGKESACNARDTGDAGLIPGLGRCPGGVRWQPTPIFLEKSHEQRSLVGYSPWGHKELDTFSLSYSVFGY